MDAPELLQGLATRTGLDQLEFDSLGVCRLVFGETVSVDLELDRARPGLLHLSTVLGRVPASGRERFYERLLEANLLGQGSGPNSLALDPALGEVVACRRLDLRRTDVELLAEALEAMVTLAEAWRTIVGSGEGLLPERRPTQPGWEAAGIRA
jgi:hypothetical protein